MRLPLSIGKLTRRETFQEHLNKATFLELFYDLIFIYCLRQILPLVTHAEGGVDLYSYYIFGFTFVQLLQVWFHSTVIMNRFGRGGTCDAVLLITNMFLLAIMVNAISINWEHYVVYNTCWALLFINIAVHWVIRFRRFGCPDDHAKRYAKRIVTVLLVQAAMVLIANPLPSLPGQILCACALLLGFFAWDVRDRVLLNENNQEHLAERCALFVVLTFGETIIGLGSVTSSEHDGFKAALFFLLVVGMFLIYLNQIDVALDKAKLGNGTGYMFVVSLQAFLITNVTAALELSYEHVEFLGMQPGSYFSLSVVLFLLSFLLYKPFNKNEHRFAGRWLASRLGLSAVVLVGNGVVQTALARFLAELPLDALDVIHTGRTSAMYLTMFVAVVAVYGIVALDHKHYLKRGLKPAEQGSGDQLAPTQDAPARDGSAADDSAQDKTALPKADEHPAERGI
ncbi:MAG: low temperature requirement protein A [Coriobacteriia bacterium]|nr:low temperature requirement protein A [Coriobacteriia bacterium]